MRESRFERQFIQKLLEMYPGSMSIKLPPAYLQGVPDRLFLYQNFWAMLEFKNSKNAPVQPNQPYYVDLLNSMSFAAFVYPENEQDVMYELQQAIRSCGKARVS